MNFDAAGEVEATADGCLDEGDLFQTDHRVRVASYVRVNVLDFLRGYLDEYGRHEFCEDG